MQPARADLVLRYSFDETGATNTPAIDTGIPPEADGIFKSSATRTTNSPFADGFSLDTTVNDTDNDYVTAGNPIKLNGLTKFTVTFWMNLQADPNLNDRMFSKISGSPAAGFEMLVFQNSDGSSTTAANFNPALQVNGLTSRSLLWSGLGHGLS
ncbi:MAG: hypothetical protein KGJ60_07140, partial [Verrucomicrobiota bacterium]|nr:hypothetical protein [Verrucomicrobiota bacterium]